MTHTILHKKLDGGVANNPPNPEIVALMMGTGMGWDDDRIAYEAAKFTIPSEDWAGYPIAIATEWATAMGRGGLTAVQVENLFMRRIQTRKGYTESVTIDDSLLPPEITTDRYFRDAIVWDVSQSNRCHCDMPKARGVHMDVIRVSRNAALAAKDIAFMRAVEAGDTSAQTTIATEKQTLRDIPQTFDLTTDNDLPLELREKWPAELPARE